MPNDIPADDEIRMRAALGLTRDPQPQPSSNRPTQIAHRRRFVRDGDMAVTMINPATSSDAISAQSPRGRLMAIEEALVAERASHGQTRRALEEALATIQALETKLAHGELAHAEAIRQEQAARAKAETALQQLQVKPQEAEHVRPHAAAATAEPLEATAVRSSRRVGRPRKEASAGVEPEPVKWWLPSYRAAKRRR